MITETPLAHILDLAEGHLASAALQLNVACKSPQSRRLQYKHLRLLRTARTNVERMKRTVTKLVVVANEMENPTPILPGLQDALLTAQEDQPKSQSPQ